MSLTDVFTGWNDGISSLARLLVFFAALTGIALAARSLVLAHRASQEGESANMHLLAAVLAGSFTVLAVIAGWLSSLIFPVT